MQRVLESDLPLVASLNVPLCLHIVSLQVQCDGVPPLEALNGCQEFAYRLGFHQNSEWAHGGPHSDFETSLLFHARGLGCVFFVLPPIMRDHILISIGNNPKLRNWKNATMENFTKT